jgi:general secretion pathway protein E
MRWRWLIVAAVLLPQPSHGAVVKLKDGTVYENVTVLRQDDRVVELQFPYGNVVLPADSVRSIDGQPLGGPPAALPPARPSSTPPAADPVSPFAPTTTGWIPSRMDGAIAGFAVVIGSWLATLIWVQRDSDRRYPARLAARRRWNTVALLAPFLGPVIYLLARRGESSPAAPPSAAEPTGPTRERLALEFLDESRQPIALPQRSAELTGLESAQALLAEAVTQRASDVHIEPQEHHFRVRFRIDGMLQERATFEKADGQRIVAALKSLAQIDVAEKRKAQDGRFSVRTALGDIDFRAATTVAIHGEKLTLRILDRKGGLLTLEQLGLSRVMQDQLDRVIRSRAGMILATGPTGSGKTSTLYAALSRLDTKRLNVMTIEDPVEYELAGATQIPVNVKAGVTYESGLRSILRQDPDVIFVGEMRDAEAATIAIRAALTGHLVFSTLHTKDALSTVVRLTELGVERQQVASALLVVVAQRLVRTLCESCREPHTASPAEWAELGVAPADRLIYRAKGCPACDGTGYQGRTGIFELLVLDEPLRKAIATGCSEQEFHDLAHARGWRSYRQDGAGKILRGQTTIEEVLQAG